MRTWLVAFKSGAKPLYHGLTREAVSGLPCGQRQKIRHSRGKQPGIFGIRDDGRNMLDHGREAVRSRDVLRLYGRDGLKVGRVVRCKCAEDAFGADDAGAVREVLGEAVSVRFRISWKGGRPARTVRSIFSVPCRSQNAVSQSCMRLCVGQAGSAHRQREEERERRHILGESGIDDAAGIVFGPLLAIRSARAEIGGAGGSLPGFRTSERGPRREGTSTSRQVGVGRAGIA